MKEHRSDAHRIRAIAPECVGQVFLSEDSDVARAMNPPAARRG